MATVAVIRKRRHGWSNIEVREYVDDDWNPQQRFRPGDLNEMAKKQILDLRKRTHKEIDSMTSGMIHVSAVETVVSMLQSGKNWVTITGNAGDGKTTLGYLVLRKLRGKIRVYSIMEPEDYWILLRINEDCVVMLDDRFGSITCDQVLINKWKTVMGDIHNQFTLNEKQVKVIFISRKNVVIETRNYLAYVQDTIFDPANVVDLSSVKIKDKRLEILDYYLKKCKLKVSPEVKQRVADLDIAYGYPHCCVMYTKLKAKKHDLDIEEFFKTPLMFLDITTSVLYKENCKDLFELMIKNNGEVDVYSVENDTQRASLPKVEREQEGSYLTVWNNGVCAFAHPSIYDSVLSVICDTDPLFGVKYATSSVIRQKLTLTSDGKMKSPTQINVKPVKRVLTVLAERFRSDILQGDYSIFSHRFCETKHFCEELVTSCTYSDVAAYVEAERRQHIDAPDKDGRTMLWTALSAGKKPAVHALVDHGAGVNITDGSGITPLLYLCKQDEVDFESIRMVIRRKVDCNVKDEKERTPLSYLCSRMRVDIETIMLMVTEGGADIKQTDEYRAMPLHWLCRNDDVSVDDIKHFTTKIQCDINKQDDFGFTPLHYLCTKNVDIEKLVTLIVDVKGDVKKADNHGNTPLHYLCMNNNVNLDFLLTKIPEADLSMKNMLGITAKEYLHEKIVSCE